MPAVRSPKASKARKESGSHSVVVPSQGEDCSSGSSSSSESYLSTPPPSPRPARRKVLRKKRTSDGFNLYRSYVLENNLLPPGTHQSNISVEVNKRWRNLPYAARQQFESEAEMQKQQAVYGKNVDAMNEYLEVEDQWDAKRAYCYAMYGVTDLFQSLSFDEEPSSSPPASEEMPRMLRHLSLDDYDYNIPSTPETPLMMTVPLPDEPLPELEFEFSCPSYDLYISPSFGLCKTDDTQGMNNALGLLFS